MCRGDLSRQTGSWPGTEYGCAMGLGISLDVHMKLVIATHNRHKVDEIRAIFNLQGVDLLAAVDIPGAPDVEEDGDTFEKNAVKKAVALARFSGCWSLADDSGLEVSALNGAPGVQSARYAGEPVDYRANNRKLLDALRDQSDRSARFCCVMALADPSGKSQTIRGTCSGHILADARGTGGFGYDPLFVPNGYDTTFSEMDAQAKNRISHRARALEAAIRQWGGILNGRYDRFPVPP